MRVVTLCDAAEIQDGTARGFDPDDEGQDLIFVVRALGVLSAWRDACPHVNGAPMAWRKDGYLNAEATRIVCHAHGAEFLPENGLCVQGPCIGRRLAAVSIEVSENGELRAHLNKT